MRGGGEDAHEGPRAAGVRKESRDGASKGPIHNERDLRDGPPERSQTQEDDAAGGSAEDDPGIGHAPASACNQAGSGRGEPLDDHTNKGPELLPLGGVTGELRPPDQVALQPPMPTSQAGKVKNERPAGAAVESARLRSELREARSLAEKFRSELSAARKM